MTLSRKIVVPINLVLVTVLAASLAWEWRRQEATGMTLLRARLDEEARFVRAAYRAYGLTPRFSTFLSGFCHAIDPGASPEHQVALVDGEGGVIAGAAEHSERPMDPTELAALGEGFRIRRRGDDTLLVRVAADGERRVVIAESTREVREQVRSNLWSHAAWYLALGGLLIISVNIIMRRAVIRPIRRLGRAVTQMEQGHLGVQVELPDRDELGALALRFNAMSRALAEHAEATRRAMETARRVQAHLLPPNHVRVGCLEVVGRCEQAGPVGGDLYDVQPLPGGRVGLLVADLSGHNVAAALHTALVRSIVWREAERARTPAQVVTRLNAELLRDLPEEHFATAFFGWFDPVSERFEYANAGHPPAVLRAPDGRMLTLEPTGPLLGILPEVPEQGESVPVRAGTRLLVFTDGLTELMNPQGEQWGAEEVIGLLGSSGREQPARLLEDVLERAARFREGGVPADDLTLLVAQYDPSWPEPRVDRPGESSDVRRAEHAPL
jgi:serine phosphatase RsbU (regulator of sigma subunit)